MQHGKTIFFSVFPDLWPNRIRKTGNMGTVGILRSSPIRGYPCLFSQLPCVSHTSAKRKNRFFPLFFWIYGQTGSGKLKIWVPLESLGQALSGVPFPTLQVPWLSQNTAKRFFGFSGFTAKPDPENGENGYFWNPHVKPDPLIPLPFLQLLWLSHKNAKREKRFFSVFPHLRPNRIRKTGNMVTVGILRSSPIRGYPCLFCSCPV